MSDEVAELRRASETLRVRRAAKQSLRRRLEELASWHLDTGDAYALNRYGGYQPAPRDAAYAQAAAFAQAAALLSLVELLEKRLPAAAQPLKDAAD